LTHHTTGDLCGGRKAALGLKPHAEAARHKSPARCKTFANHEDIRARAKKGIKIKTTYKRSLTKWQNQNL
jgi:hypothetical protein